MINIVIPMAGLGSRFARAGYATPKPLIPVHGVPMIQLVINNLRPAGAHRFIFICQRRDLRAHGLSGNLEAWAPGCEIVPLGGLTEGAACTVLAASDLIDADDLLVIANCDQYVSISVDDFLADMRERELDGSIMTMTATDPKWSYVGLGADGMARRVVEKEAISDCATVGIYSFTRGSDFVKAAHQMIQNDARVNGEFYVAPVYMEMICQGAQIGVYHVGSEGAGMYGLGIPEDLDSFASHPVSLEATSGLC